MKIFQSPPKSSEKVLTGEKYLDKKREEVRQELVVLKKRIDDIRDHAEKAEKAYMSKKAELDAHLVTLSNKVNELEARKVEALKPLTNKWDEVWKAEKKLKKQSDALQLDKQSVYNQELELESIREYQELELKKIESKKQELSDRFNELEEISKDLYNKVVKFDQQLKDFDLIKEAFEKERVALREEMNVREAKLIALKEILDQKELNIIKETKHIESKQATLKQAFDLWRTRNVTKTDQQ